MITHLIKGKNIKDIILEYLQDKPFVSIGELNIHCSEPIRDKTKPPPTVDDNYLFFLMLSKSIKELESEGKIIVSEIEKQSWVKLK